MRSFFVTGLLFACFSLYGQQLSVADMEADYDRLVHSMQEAHGGLYRYQSRQHADRIFAGYRSRIDHPMDLYAFFGLLYDLISQFHDGHMRIDFDEAGLERFQRAPLLPYSLLPEGDRLIVLSNDSRSDTIIRPGMELISINGRNVRKLFASYLSKVPADGFIETGKRRKLARGFPSYYWLFTDQSDSFKVVARNMKGREVSTAIAGVLTSDRIVDRRNNPLNASADTTLVQRYLPGDELVSPLTLYYTTSAIPVLRIHSFTEEQFEAELDSLLSIVRSRPSAGLILDLRGNSGGNDLYGALAVARFTSTPFRYFDHITVRKLVPSFADWKNEVQLPAKLDSFFVLQPDSTYQLTSLVHPGIGEQQPGKSPYTGRLVVLTDGGTFSTAADFCAALRQLKRATFIGEETGGGYYGNTSGAEAWLRLPHSKLRVRITLHDYWNAVEGGQPGRGVLPDIRMAPRVQDLLRGIDPIMVKAGSVINANQ